ncbi:MAG: hypothetical protein QNJ38_07290 [Prochloraceae cyanobacterium]|nr:hypothetical protein [Prochloraceae cyanobacterium]
MTASARMHAPRLRHERSDLIARRDSSQTLVDMHILSCKTSFPDYHDTIVYNIPIVGDAPPGRTRRHP